MAGTHEPAANPAASRPLPKGRMEAFSDGVFAIAVTLLVLELEVPDGADLWQELAREWPAFLAYLVSFAFIGGQWVAHSTLTRFVRAVDGQLMRLNLVLLLFVSFLPFTTSLLSRHLDDTGEATAVLIFGLNLTIGAALTSALFRYAASSPELAADDFADEELRGFERERRLALVLYTAATLAGLVVPVLAVLVFFGISMLILIEPLVRSRRHRKASARE
jgi:uncharacterized membrane protein